MKFEYNNNTYELLVIHVAGSRLYGNWTDESDWDYRGIIKASNTSKLGLFDQVNMLGGETGKGKSGEQLCEALITAGIPLEQTDDIQLYEVSNFVELAIKNNPNIMDTLCYDYNTDSTQYISEKGKKFLDNRNLFLSKRLKFTFSGYAIAQLNKIKSHNKWINEFPDTTKVLTYLKESFDKKDIDFQFIAENFGGKVASHTTGETSQENKTFKVIDWEEFKNGSNIEDLNNYQIPRLYDFCKAMDLSAKILDKDEKISRVSTASKRESLNTTIKQLMLVDGSFRTLGNSMYSLFTTGNGLFSKEGNIKSNEQKEVGDWICLVKANPNEYTKIKDHVNNMWNWKLKRNPSRGILEDKFGYDTKHASHLIRLMISAQLILTTDTFTPELNGENLKLVKEVRAGVYSYDWVVKYARMMEQEMDEMYEISTLQHKPQIKKINKLLLEILGVSDTKIEE